MIKIAIETYPIAAPHTGLGEYCMQIGKRLNEQADYLRSKYNIELFFILPPKYKGIYGDKVNYVCIKPSRRWLIPFYPLKFDLLHIPYQCGRLDYMHFAKKQLLTIHDINFIYEETGSKLKRATKKFENKVQHADYLCYISEFAHDDTSKHFNAPQPYKIIYNGVSDLLPKAENVTLPIDVPDNFLFHISSLMPKKNIHLLIKMMKYLPDYKLVIVGNWNNAYAKKLKQEVTDSNTKNISMLPNVTEEEKAALYSKCRALLFPSLCEGFGLPPIEAMKFGKPVFLSTLTSLPEIGGKYAFYWDELSPESMAKVLKEKLSIYDKTDNYGLLLKHNAMRFQWDKCVEQYIQYYIEILGI